MSVSGDGVPWGALALGTAIWLVPLLPHYGLTAEYGDADAGPIALAFAGWFLLPSLLALLCAVVVLAAGPGVAVRLSAAGLAAVVLLGTPLAMRLAVQEQLDAYFSEPGCLVAPPEEGGPPMGAMESQRAFDSIDHVGAFEPGGSGVDGCTNTIIVVQEDDHLDLVRHYRAALPQAGWRLVRDDGEHLRAVRRAMAFELAVCGPEGGAVWAGPISERRRARC